MNTSTKKCKTTVWKSLFVFVLHTILASTNGSTGIHIKNTDRLDIGIFNTECAQFEVRLTSDATLFTNITNFQFAVKWPVNTVDIIDVASDYGIGQQGPVYVHDGHNYAVFIGVASDDNMMDWTEGQERTILTFAHDQSGEGFADFLIAGDAWTEENNAMFYLESLGLDITGEVYHQATDTYIGPCRNVGLNLYLQGPFNQDTGTMGTAINDAGNLPLSQPYHTDPWQYHGVEAVDEMPGHIVDWILVELREANAPGVLVERRAGLLTADGYVLGADLEEGLLFAVEPGTYYLAVKHRNHIPVMSGEPVAIPNIDTPYDFTEITLTTPYNHLDPVPAVVEMQSPAGAVYGMIAGDVNADGQLKYTGPGNDRDPILTLIFETTGDDSIIQIIEGYYNEDVNLDNQVIYVGPGEDRALLLMNILNLLDTESLIDVYETVVPPLENP